MNDNAASFRTPLWHWTLPMAYHRCRVLRTVAAVAQKCLVVPVGLLRGFSWTLRPSFRRPPSGAARLRQEGWYQRTDMGAVVPEAWATLLRGFPKDSAVRLHFRRPGHFEFFLLSTDATGAPHVYGRRVTTLTGAERTVRHDLLAIRKRPQVPGTNAAQVLASSIALYRQLAVQSVTLMAGLSDGGAVWPRFGFVPASARDWQDVGRTVRANLRKVGDEYRTGFALRNGVGLDEMVELIIDDSDPKSIRSLLMLDSAARDEQARLLGAGGLGGRLLRNSRWEGILRLDDAVSMQLFDGYISRKVQEGKVLARPPIDG
ncbi:MAG TPA: hypothetical protein VJU59_44670 [Paraburkholderia sp.]|uniref:hypothetical protein n=1 Tax=Paraburkholderia sp. TaxID=1926495 RepID=UPI002B4825AC|nr:hypothetical protein [Paraburkholderia sp.]HKR46686.1 hypothetical protein [Paraburkholderia sp.]